jgi:hypothetical protein
MVGEHKSREECVKAAESALLGEHKSDPIVSKQKWFNYLENIFSVIGAFLAFGGMAAAFASPFLTGHAMIACACAGMLCFLLGALVVLTPPALDFIDYYVRPIPFLFGARREVGSDLTDTRATQHAPTAPTVGADGAI